MSRAFLPTVVSADVKADANHLAMVLGEGPADGSTWSIGQWTKDGHEYATRNLWVTADWIEAAQAPLERPAWDEGGLIDMDAAARAQEAIVLWDGEGDIPMPEPGKIVCVPGVSIQDAVQAWDLTLIEPEEIEEGNV